MPRAKVLPENRVRAHKACNLCKASKIRCDSNIPCHNCVKRGRESDCIYSTSSNSRLRQDSRRVNSASQSSNQIPSPAETLVIPKDHADQDSPQEHFIAGPNGEQLYVGENSSLSFLDFLKQTVRQSLGSTAFTEGHQQSLITDPDTDEPPEGDVQLTSDEKHDLYRSYSVVSSGILHLFTSEEADSLLGIGESTAQELSKNDVAAIEVALAIGAQARAAGPRDSKVATKYFGNARDVAFGEMIANPSPAIVRLLILLFFFAMGACRQTPASIYIGIAAKAAVMLGMNQPMSRKISHQGNEYHLRLRVWHSLCILDVTTSSLLGRCCTVPRATRHSVTDLPLDPSQVAFNAMLKGGALLDDVCRVLNRAQFIDTSSAQSLLGHLRNWCHELPSPLRLFKCTDSSGLSIHDERTMIGGLHVSSMYYFAVILITRPFLTRTLMANLRRHAGAQVPTIDSAHVVLAEVCTTAAVHMGQLCHDLISMMQKWELSLDQLSLFKAWEFNAGLVLGFSIFVGGPRTELSNAFSGVLQMLKRTGSYNIQSRLYRETLQALSDTIRLQQGLDLDDTLSPHDLVEKILHLDQEGQIGAPVSGLFPSASHGCGLDGQMDNVTTVFHDAGLPPDLSNDILTSQEGWEGLRMQFSDSFLMDFRTSLL
ncbi:hypothetical protein FAUST_4219 [Fusarium austroamericanum]|uniref:Zn(2)-C6 fungal-type domain-containing protein n=1 Tax=Fusarium austroamericanum TaxID=282268 RepID=A0AAN6C3H8_FUSAU|nr:hypothetical protein FAUST_4219 [Fusarium austroamericanum]